MSHIVAVGARSPLGLTSLQVAMCVRAKKREPRNCLFTDSRNKPIGICLTGGLHARLFGFERMLGMAVPAFVEALEELELPTPPAVVIALPESTRPDAHPSFTGFVEALAVRSGIDIAHESSSVVRNGHAGTAHALEKGLALLEQGAETVIVGAVDSYYHPGVLAWLDETYRLDAADRQDGFTPSEGAAFLVLKKSGGIAQIDSVATAKEHTWEDDEPNIGAAMTGLLESHAATPFGWVMTDNNGERHRSREWAMVSMRGAVAHEVRLEHPCAELGDVGAASGALFMSVAWELWRTGCAPTNRLLLALHSESGERGAIVMRQAG